MTLVEFYPPVAAATFLSALWFLVAYRFHKTETPGAERFRYLIWMLLLPGSLLFFFWQHGWEAPLSTYFERFMGALAGVSMGALGVFLIQTTFFESHSHAKEAGLKYVYLGLYLVFLGSGFFVF